jgi:hypothetical protein
VLSKMEKVDYLCGTGGLERDGRVSAGATPSGWARRRGWVRARSLGAWQAPRIRNDREPLSIIDLMRQAKSLILLDCPARSLR